MKKNLNYSLWIALPLFVLGSALLPMPSRAQFVYVANSLSGGLTGYSIQSDGSLKLIPGEPFAPGIAPGSVAVDSTSGYVYALGVALGAYKLEVNGALAPVPGEPYQVGPNPGSVAVDGRGRFV